MSEIQDQVATFEDAMVGVHPDDARPPQQKAVDGEAVCSSTLGVDGQSIPCLLVVTHEGPHENDDERRSWERAFPASADVPVPTDAQQAIAGTQALVAKHEADGGTVKPVGDNAERLFGEDRKRVPLEQIADDAKEKVVDPSPPTREEIDAMLRAERDTRAAACRKEVYDVCVKHDCQLTAMPTFDPMVDGGFSVGATPIIRAL